MSGHTPAPWEVRTPLMDPNAYDVYGGGAQITRGYWAHNGKADARLIAAAPDLLEALRRIDRIACEHQRGAIGEAQAVARAAIAKAEGK